MESPGVYETSDHALPVEAGCLYPYSSKKYEPPTADYVRRLMKQANLTGSMAASIVGVNDRTVRKWIADESTSNHRKISYAAWRLLLIETGLAKK